MPRILFIAADLPQRGGIRTRLSHTLAALASLGYDVDVLSLPTASPPDFASGIKAFPVRPPPFCKHLPDYPSMRRAIFNLRMLFKAILLASRNVYTLIHGVNDCGVVASLAGRVTQTPFVFERDSNFCRDGRWSARRLWCRLYGLLERNALKRADAVIGSDTDTISILARFGRHSRACIIPDIPSFLQEPSAPALNLARIRFRSGDTYRLITCVGSGKHINNEDMLFNAIPHVLAAIPQARFVFVGGTEKDIHTMRKALDKAGLADAVIFPGFLPCAELAPLLAISDVLVSPRRKGTRASSEVIDYLQSGVPIVAADTPASRALLSPDNALIVKPTPEALAEGIIRLCRSSALCARLAQNGRDTLRRENRTEHAFRQALYRCYTYVGTRP